MAWDSAVAVHSTRSGALPQALWAVEGQCVGAAEMQSMGLLVAQRMMVWVNDEGQDKQTFAFPPSLFLTYRCVFRKPQNPMRSSLRLQDTALRYFLEVVRTGSVSEAATRLSVSPSAVSRQVATLEDLLGVPCLSGARAAWPQPCRGSCWPPTRCAMHWRPTAWWQTSKRYRACGAAIRVCCSAGFAVEFPAQAMAQFREQHPGMQFHLRVAAPPL